MYAIRINAKLNQPGPKSLGDNGDATRLPHGPSLQGPCDPNDATSTLDAALGGRLTNQILDQQSEWNAVPL
jgi:hypothetical protein